MLSDENFLQPLDSESFPTDDRLPPVFDAADALLEVDSAPTLDDFSSPAVRRLQSHLRFLDTNPSLEQLSAQAPRILETLELVSELPAVLKLTIQVLARVYEPFERLGLWKEWFPRLFILYPMLVKYAVRSELIQWYESAIAHFIYVGKPESSAAAVAAVREIIQLSVDIVQAEAKPGWELEKQRFDANLTLLQLVSTSADYAQQAAEILRIVGKTRDLPLLARTYGLLAQRCYALDQLSLAFQFAQMAYCVGRRLDDPMRIIDGLHWMANVAHVAGWEKRTFRYLELAIACNAPTGDVTREAYLKLSFGAALLRYHQDDEAEVPLRYSVEHLQGRGVYYAQALYLYGMALTHFKQFNEAEIRLRKARDEYTLLKCRYETKMAEHALAYLYHKSGQHDEAVTIIDHVAADLEDLADRLHDPRAAQLLLIVRQDAADYRLARDEQTQSIRHD